MLKSIAEHTIGYHFIAYDFYSYLYSILWVVMLSFFVDREKELNMLIRLATNRRKVLIKGRRGIGKSLLATKALEELEKRGRQGTIYQLPNCNIRT